MSSCPVEDNESLQLPLKSRSLRAKSIAKRLETERNKNAPRVRKPRQKVCTMSKYRRKTANAKERDRMKQVNDAFEKLRDVVPHHRAFISSGDPANATKVSTLRCAISYINSLQQLIEDSNQGLLDPGLYNTNLKEEDLLFPPTKKPSASSSTSSSSLKKPKKKPKRDSKTPKKAPKRTANKKKKQQQIGKKLLPYSSNSLEFPPLQENLLSSYLISPLPPTQFGDPSCLKTENPALLPLQPLYLPPPPYKSADSIYGDVSDVSSASPGSTSASLESLLHPLDSSSEDHLLLAHQSAALHTPNSHILDDIQQILREAENFDIMV
eukprot:TRINITY_DN22652_c0_g1_i1.p1 TRINITY_DN22652_c0_g1~~TRINITY_DN22652_c0_g1_i1.p1  ORF type:complete len:324 (-),score=130.60 TRINITY_DN22652_c0_g1_i1:197-1168(-)